MQRIMIYWIITASCVSITVAQILDLKTKGIKKRTGIVHPRNTVVRSMNDKKNVVHDAKYHHQGTHKSPSAPTLDLKALENANEKDFQATMFLFFRNYDFDKSNSLDGLELYKAMTHLAEDHHTDKKLPPSKAEKERAIEDRVDDIDDVLLEMDDNDDGTLSWIELRNAAATMNFYEKSLGMEL